MKYPISLLFVVVIWTALVRSQTECPAQPCQNVPCDLPDCACGLSEPDDVALTDRPQIVYLSFDNAFTVQAEAYYQQLFEGQYTNPNGCPIRATFFITHQYNDYSLCNKYYNMGHEFAVKSISNNFRQDYWLDLNKTGWQEEVAGMREMLYLYAQIPQEDVVGVRASQLHIGGDIQFAMMFENDFLYDSSIPSQTYGFTYMDNGIWPYTMDYEPKYGYDECPIEPCPTCSFPGIWEQRILDLEDERDSDIYPGGDPCDILDGCVIPPGSNATVVKDFMMKNFLRAYNGYTRAPIGFYATSAWFLYRDFYFEGYRMFIEEITTNPEYQDTWIVPIRDGIAYRRNPVPLDVLNDNQFEPFQCDNLPQAECNYPFGCRYFDVDLDGQHFFELTMKVCEGDEIQGCPPEYPWVGNIRGGYN